VWGYRDRAVGAEMEGDHGHNQDRGTGAATLIFGPEIHPDHRNCDPDPSRCRALACTYYGLPPLEGGGYACAAGLRVQVLLSRDPIFASS